MKQKGTKKVKKLVKNWAEFAKKRREDPDFANKEKNAHKVSLGLKQQVEGDPHKKHLGYSSASDD